MPQDPPGAPRKNLRHALGVRQQVCLVSLRYCLAFVVSLLAFTFVCPIFDPPFAYCKWIFQLDLLFTDCQLSYQSYSCLRGSITSNFI